MNVIAQKRVLKSFDFQSIKAIKFPKKRLPNTAHDQHYNSIQVNFCWSFHILIAGELKKEHSKLANWVVVVDDRAKNKTHSGDEESSAFIGPIA